MFYMERRSRNTLIIIIIIIITIIIICPENCTCCHTEEEMTAETVSPSHRITIAGRQDFAPALQCQAPAK